MEFLEDVSRVLSEADDGDAALSRLAHLVVPELADWSSVHVVDAAGTLRRLAVVHADPAKADLVGRLLALPEIDSELDIGIPQTLRSGEPQLLEAITPDLLDRLGPNPALRAVYEELGCASAMSVPIVARGHALGSLGLVRGADRPAFDRADVLVASDLARRCALVIDNARLYRMAKEALDASGVSAAILDALLSLAPVGIAMFDDDLRIVRANDALCAIGGIAPASATDRTLREALPQLAEAIEPAVRRVAAGRDPVVDAQVSDRPPGDPSARHFLLSAYPVTMPDGSQLGTGLVLIDVTRERLVSGELQLRARQQAAVAEIGERGLAGVKLDSLLEDAASLVASTLDVELSELLELDPGHQELLLRAGVGWRPGVVGTVRLPTGRDSQAGYTLLADLPVISDHATETRFTPPAALVEHGVRSGVTVVIAGPEGRWGVLGAHTSRRRTFTDDDVAFLQSIANVLGSVIQRRRTIEDLRDSQQRLELALGAGGLGTWEWHLGTDVVRWSGAIEEIFGPTLPGTAATFDLLFERVHGDDRQVTLDAIGRSIESGDDLHILFRLTRADGEIRWVEARAQVVQDPSGRPVRLAGVAGDVTERRRMEDLRLRLLESEHAARLSAEAVRERLAFVAEASAALSENLGAADVLATVVRLVVPRLCDWCVIDALDDSNELQEAAIAHRDPSHVARIRESRRRRLHAGGPGLWSVRRTIATGRAELVAAITDADIHAAAVDAEHLELLRTLAPRSAITAPLITRGRVLGGLTLVISGEDRRFDSDDLALAEDLAGRVAITLDNVRLLEDRTRVARTLQNSLLPPALPQIPGIDLAARYLPAGSGLELGGDFYDLFEMADGAWAIAIGDVCGKGTAAAALTGLFRHTLRAAAVREDMPSRVLALTNDAILDQIDDTRFCTAAFLRLVADEHGAKVEMSCGGHPEPLLLRADGGVETVNCRGTLLGVMPDPRLVDEYLELAPGDSLLLYTDGVTEARSDGEIFGEDRLLEVARACAGLTASEIAEHLERAVADFEVRAASDDIAILVIRVAPTS